MARPKFQLGDPVEMRCPHLKNGQVVVEWLAGIVVKADYRMAAVQFQLPVYTATGLPIPNNILWAAHGSPNLRPSAKKHTNHD